MEEVEVDLQMAANPDGRPEYLSIGSHIAMGIKRNEKQKSHEEAFRKIADIIQAEEGLMIPTKDGTKFDPHVAVAMKTLFQVSDGVSIIIIKASNSNTNYISRS